MTRFRKLHAPMGLLLLGLAVALLSGCANRGDTGVTEVTDPTAGTGGETTTPPGQGGDPGSVDVDPNAWKSDVRDVFFDYDKYELRADARSVLQENARYLKDHSGADLTLEGHCDERGTDEYNLALGQRRADVVRAYLVDLGVSGTRLRTVSYGEERPFVLGSDEGSWSQNRRVHFVIQ